MKNVANAMLLVFLELRKENYCQQLIVIFSSMTYTANYAKWVFVSQLEKFLQCLPWQISGSLVINFTFYEMSI